MWTKAKDLAKDHKGKLLFAGGALFALMIGGAANVVSHRPSAK
jgi:hypothetical protein